jgi:predicted transcriptional regulator
MATLYNRKQNIFDYLYFTRVLLTRKSRILINNFKITKMSNRTNIRTSRMQQYIRELLREEGLESDSDEP